MTLHHFLFKLRTIAISYLFVAATMSTLFVQGDKRMAGKECAPDHLQNELSDYLQEDNDDIDMIHEKLKYTEKQEQEQEHSSHENLDREPLYEDVDKLVRRNGVKVRSILFDSP